MSYIAEQFRDRGGEITDNRFCNNFFSNENNSISREISLTFYSTNNIDF